MAQVSGRWPVAITERQVELKATTSGCERSKINDSSGPVQPKPKSKTFNGSYHKRGNFLNLHVCVLCYNTCKIGLILSIETAQVFAEEQLVLLRCHLKTHNSVDQQFNHNIGL